MSKKITAKEARKITDSFPLDDLVDRKVSDGLFLVESAAKRGLNHIFLCLNVEQPGYAQKVAKSFKELGYTVEFYGGDLRIRW